MDQLGIGRDKNFFRNPEKFKPDRWDKNQENIHPFSMMVFGFGPRACFGINYNYIANYAYMHTLKKLH